MTARQARARAAPRRAPAPRARPPRYGAIDLGTNNCRLLIAAPTRQGPGREEEGFRVSVSACWAVDPGAQWSETVVTVAFEMNRDGNPMTDTIRMIADNGGPDTRRAFDAARRAIIRCARGGYPLPEDKFAHWRQVELTFDPRDMSLR